MTEYKQLRNPDLVAQLSSDFLRRNDVVLAYKSLGMVSILPFCRAAFLFSSVEATANPRIPDLTGAGSSLRESGTPAYGIYTDTLISYGDLSGGAYWYPVAATWDTFSGIEGHIVAANRGMTVLGWVRFANAPVALEAIVGKSTGAIREYRFFRNGVGEIGFGISTTGAAWDVVATTTTAPANDTDWHFVCGRFATGSEIYVRCDNDSVAAATAAAGINTGLANVEVGAVAGGNNMAGSFASLGFYCGALSNAHVKMYYHATAPLFNKRPTD